MNIIMLVGEGDSSKIVYNSLSKDFDIKMVIEDTSISKKTFLKRRIKKLGYLKVFGQILFMIYNKLLFHKSKKQIENEKQMCILSLPSIKIEKITCNQYQ